MKNLLVAPLQRPPTDTGEVAPTPAALVAAVLTRCPLPARAVALRDTYQQLSDERARLQAALRAARPLGTASNAGRHNPGSDVAELERALYSRAPDGSPPLDERTKTAKASWLDARAGHIRVARLALRPLRQAAGERLAAALEVVRQEAALLRAHDAALLKLGDSSPDVTPFVDQFLAPIDAAARRAQRGAD